LEIMEKPFRSYLEMPKILIDLWFDIVIWLIRAAEIATILIM